MFLKHVVIFSFLIIYQTSVTANDKLNVVSTLPEDHTLPEMIRQDQRLNLLKRNIKHTDSIIKSESGDNKINRTNVIVTEKPCSNISKIKFVVNNAQNKKDIGYFNSILYDLNGEGFITGHCIGTKSLKNIINYAQNEILKAGFITSQIDVDPQDLNSGELVLNLHVGRIHSVISQGSTVSNVEIFTAMPIKKNEVLDIKKIDQGLENLKRVSQREIYIKIVPAVSDEGEELIGYSNIIVSSQPYKKIGLNLGIDNSGSDSTGVYIGNLGISINNPLFLNDNLNLSLSHSLDDWHKNRNQSVYASYSIPFKKYDLTTSYNKYSYEQFIAGYNAPILYSGESEQSNLTLSRLLSRGAHHKTTFYSKIYQKKNNNFIENIEITVQRRKTAGWHAGLQHRQYLGTTLIDLNLDYKRGTGLFGAMPAPEEQIVDIFNRPLPSEGYARAPIWSADVRINYPFLLINQPAQYRVVWRGQYAPKILIPQDRFFIGSRYSVRGFKGDIMLSGDNGHYLQQEINWNNSILNSQLYLGIDQGWVNGRNSIQGKRYLLGSVLGIRSYQKRIYLDGFVGRGLITPQSLRKEWTSGFSLNFTY